ncbi:MAG: 50S ribosomal protein L24 [Saprospiraceae bacterium]|nr:50S ribosomal protein L24 [Saprospiraceae bacterium]
MIKKTGNDKRFTPKLKIKKGDKVVVISGAFKDRSKPREVLEVFPDKNRAIVDGVNIRKKHQKPTQANPNGGIIDLPAPIHLSNLMLVDPRTGEPTRVGRKEDDGKLVRYSKKTGNIIK